MTAQHTPGPWIHHAESVDPAWHIVTPENGMRVVANVHIEPGNEVDVANAHLIAAAPDMLAALRLHKAWADSETAGPDYGGQSRATHPDGEKIWRVWWNNQLDLCDRAQSATSAAIAKAEGRAP